MKNYFQFLLLIFCFAIFSRLNAQTYQWAKSSIGNSNDEGWSVATDKPGNVVVTGSYLSPFFSFGTNTIINVGGHDIFLSRFDSNGNAQWTKTAGGNSEDESYSVATDAWGNIYIAGWSQSPTISFGTINLNTVGAQDIFLAKYDTLGNEIWAKSFGGISTDIAYGIATDKRGNVFIVGEYYSPTISFGAFTLTNTGNNGIYLAKCDSAGNVLWAKTTSTSNGYSSSHGIATDLSGNVFQTGYFSFDSISFGSNTLFNNNSGADNIFIVKYDSTGNVLWAKSSQGAGSNYANAVATDFSGNCYITGLFSYSPTISFGNLTLTNSNSITSEVFVVKYDSSGNEKWANSGSCTGDDVGYSIATDTLRNVYVTGAFDRNANQFSPISFGPYSLPYPSGAYDPIYIVKYDSSGFVQCATSLASGGDDKNAIAVGPDGNLFLAGDFIVSPFVLGTDTLFLSNPSNENVFVAKLSMPCLADGIPETTNSSQLIIFPNPSNGIFNLDITNSNYLLGEIRITDILGNLLFQSKIENLKSKIDLSGNANGIYFYQISNENGIIYYGKLILEK